MLTTTLFAAACSFSSLFAEEETNVETQVPAIVAVTEEGQDEETQQEISFTGDTEEEEFKTLNNCLCCGDCPDKK